MSTKIWQPALAFTLCVILGACMGSQQLALANGLDCSSEIDAELLEVRRIEGTGDLSAQEASWQENLAFEADNNLLVLWNLGECPLEEFALDEEVP